MSHYKGKIPTDESSAKLIRMLKEDYIRARTSLETARNTNHKFKKLTNSKEVEKNDVLIDDAWGILNDLFKEFDDVSSIYCWCPDCYMLITGVKK